MPQTAPSRIEALTGLRFLAALWVFAFHFNAWHGWPGAVSAQGWTGVSVFFVLSGVLMQRTYGGWFSSGVPGARLRNYAVGRFARVYPLHVLVLLVCGVQAVYLWHDPSARPVPSLAEGVSSVVASLAMLQAFWIDWATVNPPSWTLSCDAFFYAVLPLLAGRIAGGRTSPRSALIRIGVIAAAYVVAVGVAAGVVLVLRLPPVAFAKVLHNLPLLRVFEFGIGVAAVGLLPALAGRPGLRNVLLAAGAVMLLGAGILGPKDPHRLVLVALYGLISAASLMVVLGLASGTTVVSGLLSLGAMRLAGEVSFGFYLWQWPLRVGFMAILGEPAQWAPWLPLVVGALCFGLSWLTWRFFEVPLRTAIRHRWQT